MPPAAPFLFEIKMEGREKGMQTAKEILDSIGAKEIRLGYTGVFLIDFTDGGKNAAVVSPPAGDPAEVRGGRGRWPEHWLVIGYEDSFRDPIFLDTSQKGLPVYTAMCGEGKWFAERIAASVEGFAASLRRILILGEGRECPVSLMKNPISQEAKQRSLEEICRLNPGAKIDFWERWLEG